MRVSPAGRRCAAHCTPSFQCLVPLERVRLRRELCTRPLLPLPLVTDGAAVSSRVLWSALLPGVNVEDQPRITCLFRCSAEMQALEWQVMGGPGPARDGVYLSRRTVEMAFGCLGGVMGVNVIVAFS